MRVTHFALALLPLFTAAVSGCAANTSADSEVAGDIEVSQDDLRRTPNAGFYVVTARDYRRCASPMCGGLFVKQVNAATTRCADGTLQESCYVSEIVTKALGLNDDDTASFRDALADGQALVRTTRMSFTVRNGERIGKLIANEGWVAQGTPPASTGPGNTLPAGSFFRVKDNGIRCIRAPCPTTSMFTLNGSESRSATDLDLSGAGASDAKIEAAFNARFTEKGFLLVGSVEIGEIEGVTVKATQFYAPVTASSAKACVRGGCSGQICSDQEGVISTCEFRPEYACYAGAACARQTDGNCGWTASPELSACLQSPPSL